ncbi:hypothetical protein [Streptomyces aureus]|uniref:hypothetical protein n=1 Tax=Streptomyces aureus TaxID=193461 RepID=UPI00131E492A|nr:hypothetical protein [Streptomyces aureus]
MTGRPEGTEVQVSMLSLWGAGAFGAVIGWIAYRTLRRAANAPRITDLITVIAALGGGAVINTQFAEPDLFACYGIGLFVGFFAYFVVGLLVDRSERKAQAKREKAQIPAQATQAVEATPAGTTDRVGAEQRSSTWMGDL